MSEVAFIVSVPPAKADAGTFLDAALQLVQRITNDLGQKATLIQIVKSDKVIIASEFTQAATAPTSNPTQSRTGTVTHTSTSIAGGAAGDHTVTGIKTTDELVAVVSIDDTTHAGTVITSECTISAAATINNAAGTNTTGGHVVVAYRRV